MLEDVTFASCILSGASFRFSRLRNVRFEDCRLDETEFSNAKMRNVSIARCHIEATAFHHAQLEGVDLRSSTLMSINGVEYLKNVIIDDIQSQALAPQFAKVLGIKVETHEIEQIMPPLPPFDIIDEPTVDESTVDEPTDEEISAPPEALDHVAELRQQLGRAQ